MVTGSQDWLDAQIGVLGSVLIQPDLAAKVLSETCEEDFSGTCLTVYRAIRSLFQQGKPTDPIMVKDALGAQYADYLLQIMEVTPSAANVEHYISACRSRSQLLQLRSLGQALQDAETLEDANALLEKAHQASIRRTGVEIVTMEDAMTSFFERHDKPVKYLPWPISGLDEQLFADAGDFIILGGYPSDGKSAFAIQTAFLMSKMKRVGFFSLETNQAKLHDRLMAHAVKIDMRKIKRNALSDKDWTVAGTFSQRIISRKLEYIPAAGKTVAEIQAISQARRYDVIFIDYLQLVSAPGKDRFSVVTDVSVGLHLMAQSTGITVIALSQLTSQEYNKDGSVKAPQMDDLRESRQISQDADIILLLYRPWPNDKSKQERILLVRKNKEGELGSISLAFDGKHQTFVRPGETYDPLREDFDYISDDIPVPFEQMTM